MGLAALHCHSEYSARDSLLRVGDLPKIAAEQGWDSVALTDHGGMEGAVRFVEASKDVGIKSIVGCELYVSCKESDRKYHHLTVLAKNARGFSSLCEVISYGNLHHWVPRSKRGEIPFDYLMEHLHDCIVLSGCASSPIWREKGDAMGDLARMAEKFGDDFFLEVQALYDWPHQHSLNRDAFAISKDLHIPVVVTPDCHFGTQEEGRFHDALLAVASRKQVGSPDAWTFSTKLNYIMTPGEIAANLRKAGATQMQATGAVANTERVDERIEAWSWDELRKPTFPSVPEPDSVLTAKTIAGFHKRGLPDTPEYKDRIDRELATFVKGGLASYLILVKDCVDHFQEKGAEIGPRGSVGGSLVAYCLGLTTIDPMKHGLTYERFYAPGRIGWPDVDIDVDTEFRQRVPEILRAKYGDRNIAQISNITKFGLRSAIRAAAKTYGITLLNEAHWEDDKDAEKIEDLPTGRELIRKSLDGGAFAKMLVGRVQNFGTHAGGFVIDAEHLNGGRSYLVPRGKNIGLCWDKDDAEKLGFVKFDFLGNDSLKAIQAIGAATNINWDDVPLDDAETIVDMGEGRTAAVPQFQTAGLRTFCEMLKPETFEDLIWANGAYRPGALGQMSPEELAEKYRKDPGSIWVYQEDVMAACVELAGFSWTEADKIRKIIGKSQGAEAFAAWEDRFVKGCSEKGLLQPSEASAFWQTLVEFGRYSFNKAHATAYTWNAYRIAWAKRNFPHQTFPALLNADKDQTQQLLDEVEEFGINIAPANANTSGLEWEMGIGKILPPLTAVTGIDGRVANAILHRRNKNGLFEDRADFLKRMKSIKYDAENVSARLFGFEVKRAPMKNPKRVLGTAFQKAVKACQECELRATCRAPVPPEYGRTSILLVGEAPGRNEDRRGRPFIGKSGKFLMDTLAEYGVSRVDVTLTNAVKCWPPDTKELEKHIDKCNWLKEEVEKLDPPLILALGRKAWNKLGGEGGIMKANGTVTQINGRPVLACVHPSMILRKASVKPEFVRTIKKFGKMFRDILNTSESGGPTKAVGNKSTAGTDRGARR